MIVCYFGTYRENYNRNKIMIAALRSAGVTVKECHVTLWHGIEDRVSITAGGWRKPHFWWRVLKAYCHLLWKYLHIGAYDVLMVGYPGHFDVFLARLLANLKRKPLVWDVLISLYTVAKERKLDQARHSSVKFIRRVEAKALNVADLMLQDTAEYVRWFEAEYGISSDRFKVVPIGADDRIFRPLAVPKPEDGLFHILYYGSYIPNHGVMVILNAAQLLHADGRIVFDMIGDGPERSAAEAFVKSNGLDKVRFQDWIAQEELVRRISAADLCLGAFGDRPQSWITVHNKAYECMAVGRPVLTGDSPAIRDAFTPGEDIVVCDHDPQALAESILHLKADPDLLGRLASAGYRSFIGKYSLSALGQLLMTYLDELSAD